MKTYFLVLMLGFISGNALADQRFARVITCENSDAAMEIYSPTPVSELNTITQVQGYYALDLTKANKGKALEPVLIRLSEDGSSVIVNQYTRGLVPAHVPVAGGKVDFDQRFAAGAVCETEK